MDNKDKKEIGKRFRAAIVAKFGKLVKGAEALGMSPQSLHNYCKGERIPGREMVDKLDLLGINSDYIMLKTDNINQLKKPELVSDKTKHYYSTEGNIARLVDENFALKALLNCSPS